MTPHPRQQTPSSTSHLGPWRDTLAGAVAWLLSWPLLPMATSLLLLGPLVVLPAVLVAMPAGLPYEKSVRKLHLPAVATLLLSVLLPAGLSSALLALPFAVETLLLTRMGWRVLVGLSVPLHARLALAAGLLMQMVGGSWLVVLGYGSYPFGFDKPLVELTVVHTQLAPLALLCFCGFAVIAGRSASAPTPTSRSEDDDLRREEASSEHPIWPVVAMIATLLGLAGFLLVAIGISAEAAWAEEVGAYALVGCALFVVVVQLRAGATLGGLAGTALFGSALCMCAGMVLAGLFASGFLEAVVWLDRQTMLLWHGHLNGLGFAALGAVGYAMGLRPKRSGCTGRPRGSGRSS